MSNALDQSKLWLKELEDKINFLIELDDKINIILDKIGLKEEITSTPLNQANDNIKNVDTGSNQNSRITAQRR